MWNLGWPEMMVIFVLALLLFGPKKLPEVGKQVAKALGEFRRASNELKDTWHREMAAMERETQEIKKEAESVALATSDYSSDYNYDSSYDYGAYGYPEGEQSAEAASATDAAQTGEATVEGAAAETAQAAESAPEIVAAADTVQATEAPAAPEGSAPEPAAR
jgi:TatA/E family protein of Tat protein translocase